MLILEYFNIFFTAIIKSLYCVFLFSLSNIFKEQGSNILNSIGGPNEAMREASPYFKLADDWYHWAVVPAGFFRK